MTFKQWMEELNIVADKDGFVPDTGFAGRIAQCYWEDLYEEGLTPQEAWDRT